MTFAEYFSVLQRRWRIWIAMLVLGLLGGAGASAATQVSYTATATTFVSVAEAVDSGQGEIFQGSQFTVQRVKSYAPLVDGPDVLRPVIDDLGLDLTVRELARKVLSAAYRTGQTFGFGHSQKVLTGQADDRVIRGMVRKVRHLLRVEEIS
mgnify:CR=1 FL=1